MNIFVIRRKNLFILFAVFLLCAFFYLSFSISNIEQEAFKSNQVQSFKEKIDDLDFRLGEQEQNLEGLEQGYKNQSPGELKIAKKVIAMIPKVSEPIKIYLNQCEWFGEQSEMNTDIQANNLISKISFDDVDGGVWKQGYDIEYNEKEWTGEKKLTVIVIPHSHNDPGWLMTFEDYFMQRTKNILDTIVNSLTDKPSRKFIWAETSYLSLWWSQADGQMKRKMKRLIVETKQLEIVTGGWVMNDEANSYYYAMIEQMIEGHEWLKSNIDPSIRPNYGWSIDPFGYTPTMAYLLKKMGFDAMLIQRVHYILKKHLSKTNQLEFNWRQHWSTAKSQDTSIFCHVMPFYSYDVPHTCGPDPKICCQFDFARMISYGGCPWGIKPQQTTKNNVEKRAWMLLDQYRKKAQLYGGSQNHDTLLVPLGDDFRYRDMNEANLQFENYEMLMEYMNSRSDWNVDIKFGTLRDYFELLAAKNEERGHVVDTFSGDFFTYADREDHYWSGYYTSRPFNKRLDRVVEGYLRSAEIAFTFANSIQAKSDRKFAGKDQLYKKLLTARRNLGLFQHHDGITGTSKTLVVNDYANKLYKCLTNSRQIIEDSLGYLINKNPSETFNQQEKMLSLDDVRIKSNINDKYESVVITLSDANPQKTVFLWNSNLAERIEIVSFRVNTAKVQVLNSTGHALDNIQLSLIWPNMDGSVPDESTFQSSRMTSTADLKFAFDFNRNDFELLFQVRLAPLSVTKFVIKQSSESTANLDMPDVKFYHANHQADKFESLSSSILKELSEQMKIIASKNIKVEAISTNKSIKVRSGKYVAEFSQKTGHLKNLLNAETKRLINSEIKFVKYGTTDKKEKSGAYLFLPDGPAKDLDYSSFLRWIRVERNGKLRNRVCVDLTLLLHCVEMYPTIEISKGLNMPQLSIWNVVDLRQSHNYELAMHIISDIENNDEFYTDLNGFQYTKRKNYKKLTIQGNVYPMPSGAYIQDGRSRMSVLTAQPLGVASQDKSSLQVFLDRRLDQDDNRGMEQAMNDNVMVSSRFVILFEEIDSGRFESGDVAKGYPSLMAQMISFGLISPVAKLIVSEKIEESIELSEASLSNGKKYPCDLRMVNMRTMQAGDERPEENEIGLILHRLAHEECSPIVKKSKYVEELCDVSSKSANFYDIFSYFSSTDLKVKSAYLTLRPKQDNEEVITPDDAILKNVEPMQIEAFMINL